MTGIVFLSINPKALCRFNAVKCPGAFKLGIDKGLLLCYNTNRKRKGDFEMGFLLLSLGIIAILASVLALGYLICDALMYLIKGEDDD